MKRSADRSRSPPPQRAMRKYIGMRTISKARKKSIRSSTAKVASVPASSSRSRATNAFGDGLPSVGVAPGASSAGSRRATGGWKYE